MTTTTPPEAPGLAVHERVDRDHTVQFYESAEHLCHVVADFVADGFASGEAVVLVLTMGHHEALRARLSMMGVADDIARALRRLTTVDAEEILGRVMVGSMPDWHRFQSTVGALVRPPGVERSVRVYGEMVDVLWREGNTAGAMALEQMWSELRKVHPFSLLCAYSIRGFRDELGVQAVCRSHDAVLPLVEAPPGERPSETPILRALVSEIAYRTQIERALRRSVSELREAEETARRNNEQARRIATITAAIAEAVTAQQVLEAVVDQVASALRASTAGLWTTADDGHTATPCRRS